jgi:hypothetical protein
MGTSPQLSTRARAWALFCQLTDQLKRVHGLAISPTSFLRSAEEQHALYLQLLTPCDGYKSRSSHQDGRACDFIIERAGQILPLTDPAYLIMGSLWKTLDPRNVWGGDWIMPNKTKDFTHCEFRP